MSKTIIIDLDGCVFRHPNTQGTTLSDILDIASRGWDDNNVLLPGVKEKFNEWYTNGCNIIILTGRPESSRQTTMLQLESYDLFYDQLIMGVKHYPRILINDTKPSGLVTAIACPVERNKGLKDINI